MLHHAGVEIVAAEVDRAVLCFELLGFTHVEPPPTLADGFTWLDRDGTQIHLIHAERPMVPRRGHVAVVATDFDAALERLREHGFDPEPGFAHWGEARANVHLEGGQRVEVMAAPPGPY